MENTPKSICCNADIKPAEGETGGNVCTQCENVCSTIINTLPAEPLQPVTPAVNPPEEIKKTPAVWAEEAGAKIVEGAIFTGEEITKEEFEKGLEACTVELLDKGEKDIELPPSRYAKDPKTGKYLTGRPTRLTPIMIKKLEEMCAMDASLAELCFYCDISKPTYYNWVNENPELFARLEALRERPILKARRTILAGLDDVDQAFRYISRKRKDEFSEKQIIAGEGGFAVKQTDERLETLLKNANPEQRAKLLEAVDGIQPEGNKEGAV